MPINGQICGNKGRQEAGRQAGSRTRQEGHGRRRTKSEGTKARRKGSKEGSRHGRRYGMKAIDGSNRSSAAGGTEGDKADGGMKAIKAARRQAGTRQI